ncbi:hypothetical protein N0V93_004388 [Gnomoniopsis smithogilvyi]|uniref:Methyltransferase n=1 Tax=Gnomoniopsis smithogilvyi TaxID=1191159 RepID=A0A9W8YTM5_9PEZI|nr:hypothetical protein N0V93_004388 [Gnomoniopsis smithogilvyi]
MTEVNYDEAEKAGCGEGGSRSPSVATESDQNSVTQYGLMFDAETKAHQLTKVDWSKRWQRENKQKDQAILGSPFQNVQQHGLSQHLNITPEDLQHRIWRLAMNDALAWAPLHDTELLNVLDIGTGTGAWAIDFAESHPEAQIFGVDTRQIQPVYVPPNCHFLRENSEKDWSFKLRFDYIHLRMMATCFSSYEDMVKKVFTHLRPGGWVEYQEFCMETTSDDKHTQHVLRNDPASPQGLLNRLKEGFSMLGRDIDVTNRTKDWLLAAGFVDVVEKKFSVPITPWSSDPKEREIGRLQVQNWYVAVESAVNTVYAALQPEEQEAYIVACQENLKAKDLKIYHTCSVIYGRKPHLSEVKS